VKIARWFCGRRPSVSAQPQGVEVWTQDASWILADPPVRPKRDAVAPPCAYAPTRGDFTVADLGACERLAWSRGACALPPDAELAFWNARYITWIDRDTLVILDLDTARLVRLAAPGLFTMAKRMLVCHAQLAIVADPIITLELAELEALFAAEPGPRQLTATNHAPFRRNRRLRGTVDYIGREFMVVMEDGARIYVRPNALAVEGMAIEASDELAPETFLHWQRPDGASLDLPPPAPTETFAATLELAPCVDPAGDALVVAETPARQLDVDGLFRQFADAPDDPATPSVLIDLLQDSGVFYGETLARIYAGERDPALQREALGPLALFLVDLGFTQNLPTSGTLSATAPVDADFVEAACADQRLGFLHALRLGEGSAKVYARLVASSRAVGLRDVDVPNPTVLQALVAGKRTELVRLANVKFTSKDVIFGLADPTFDRVTTVHVETAPRMLAAQLAFFTRDEAGFWKRAPRRLVLTNKSGDDDALHADIHAAWPTLPVTGVTAGSLSLVR
jgi:hypothetical protein